MNKDDAIKAMKDRVKEGKARKSRMWLDELERKVKGPAKATLWANRGKPAKPVLDVNGEYLWENTDEK